MLGAATMRSVGAQPDGLVRITVADPLTGARHPAAFRVTGRAAPPPSLGPGGRGTGAALTGAGLPSAQCPPGARHAVCASRAAQEASYWVLVTAPGRAGAAAVARYTHRYPGFVAVQEQPVELVNFGESANFPLLFGGLLALFGAATMVHLLVGSSARTGTEAGLLNVLGFLQRQVAPAGGW